MEDIERKTHVFGPDGLGNRELLQILEQGINQVNMVLQEDCQLQVEVNKEVGVNK